MDKRVNFFFGLTWFFLAVLVVFMVLIYNAEGQQGARGIQGLRGEKGESAIIDYSQIDNMITEKVAQLPTPKSGEKGENGAPGNDGHSAYDLWLAQGNAGSIKEFLNSLR